MAERYRIGEFAALSGITAKTLRFYDEIGLLTPACVDSRNGYRLYVADQLQDLAAICVLKEAGLPLSEIRYLMKKAACSTERREMLIDLKKMIEQSMQKAEQSLAWVNAALEALDGSRRPIPIVVKRRPAVAIASVRSRLRNYSEVEGFEKALLREVPSEAVGNLRGVLWHRCADSGCLEAEPFVALKGRVPARSVYDLKQLAPATLACAYSKPDDDDAEPAYDAIRRWMAARNYILAGPKRETYLPDMLEIQFPLQAA
jgi:DNA-binding transcriptional MerR regulator